MIRTALRSALALALLACSTVGSAQDSKLTIFVGPQVRDGFVDIDSGIRDSTNDIKQEFRKVGITLAPNREDATIAVIVLARGLVPMGSIGSSSGIATNGSGSSFGFVLPNNVPTLTTILRVGQYERRTQSEGGDWRTAARTVVQDTMAWLEANEKAMEARK